MNPFHEIIGDLEHRQQWELRPLFASKRRIVIPGDQLGGAREDDHGQAHARITLVPWPSALLISTQPPSCFITPRTIGSPRPVPFPGALVV